MALSHGREPVESRHEKHRSPGGAKEVSERGVGVSQRTTSPIHRPSGAGRLLASLFHGLAPVATCLRP